MAELAIKIGLPARALEATVRTFNAACSQAKDFAYRRDDSAAVAAFERGEPFDWTGVMDGLATEGIEPGLGASERTPNAGVGIGDERAPTIEKVLYPAYTLSVFSSSEMSART